MYMTSMRNLNVPSFNLGRLTNRFSGNLMSCVLLGGKYFESDILSGSIRRVSNLDFPPHFKHDRSVRLRESL